MDTNAVENLVAAAGGEKRNLEFKQSVDWNNFDNQVPIIRSILGMSNIEGGGRIIIGVVQNANGMVTAAGMSQSDFVSFVKDQIKAVVANYADEHAEFEVDLVADNNKRFVVITVSEFAEYPVLCKKTCKSSNGKKELEDGKLYTRSYRIPETIEVRTVKELRDILELATRKGIARFLGLATALKLLPAAAQSDTDTAQFDKEIASLK